MQDSVMERHLNDIKRIDKNRLKNRKGKPVYFTREEEKELWEQYQNGDKSAGEALVESQLKHVVKISNKFKRSKISSVFHSDILGVGYEGLITALETFEPDKGSFATWVRRCVNTKILLYEKSLNKFSNGIEGHVESGNKTVTNGEPTDTDAELFDFIEDETIEEDENRQYKEQVLNEQIEKLPLRDKEIVTLFFFQNKKKKDLPYLLTPLYENEWANIYKYGTNYINLEYKTLKGEKRVFCFDVLTFFKNEEENSEIIQSDESISLISHKYRYNQRRFELDTFIAEMNDVNEQSINFKLNGEKLPFIVEDGILTVELRYNTGYICSDINSRLEKTLDKLRTNIEIISLMDI